MRGGILLLAVLMIEMKSKEIQKIKNIFQMLGIQKQIYTYGMDLSTKGNTTTWS